MDQPYVDPDQGKAWLLDRYDNLSLPPGPAAFVLGRDRDRSRPWEKDGRRHLRHDHQVIKPKG